MISPVFVDQFKYDASLNEAKKQSVKQYIANRYELCKDKPISVYSVCVGFQMRIGAVPQSALCHWLNEWGYHVTPAKGNDDRNHSVFIKLKKEFD